MNKELKKPVVFGVISLALFLAILFLAFVPIFKNLQQNEASILKKQNELDGEKAKINALKANDSNDKEFSKISEIVNNYIPDTTNVSDFIVQTEGLAKDLGITIDSFSIDESKSSTTKTTSSASTNKDKSSKNSVKFIISTKASFSQIVNLMKKMETLSRLNSVSSLDLTSSENGQLSVNLTGYIYYGK